MLNKIWNKLGPWESKWFWLKVGNYLVPGCGGAWTPDQHRLNHRSRMCLECDMVDVGTRGYWIMVQHYIHVGMVQNYTVERISDYPSL